ncbi:hypothetical protein K449DRAFT_385014 [Hypoxylon sp. EC38]|nr:hypothetical protein K449DRAFT_385014 [Hypoxylon sp. EC38]
MENNSVRRISCKRCQHRKIRCSRTYPCGSCSAANVKCEFRDNDFKRPPISREYAAALESRVATLEGILKKLKDASNGERDALLEDVVISDHLTLPSFESPQKGQGEELNEAMAKASLLETNEGSMIYHGPTSIFNADVGETLATNALPTTLAPLYEDPATYHNPTTRLCLALFFYWQYPQVMFIDREAFVQEFELDPICSEFCSPPLIHAACALGALMSPDADIRALAPTFADSAENTLVRQGLATPRITSVQALLCCAFYEVGMGNLSKGWMYSGMAFRMGQDLGIQRDPTHWGRPVRSTASYFFDDEFRRRIYWGCFLSDKIFSLFLGRPTFMHENDADVDTSEPLPHNPPIWDNWLQTHDLSYMKTIRPAGPKLTLLFNQQVELGRIIHDMLANVFAPKRKGSANSKRWTTTALQQLNARLLSWHEALPADMRWKKWFTNKDRLQTNVTVLHTLYHSTRICLNIPFITTTKSNVTHEKASAISSSIAEAIKICKSSAEGIVDILERFKSQHTLGNTPLILVQGAIVATNAVVVTSRISEAPISLMEDTPFPILDEALNEMSVSWKLASEARERFRKALSLWQPEQHAPAAAGEHVWVHDINEPPDMFQWAQATGSEFIQYADSVQGADFESPEQYLWEPMGFINTEPRAPQ